MSLDLSVPTDVKTYLATTPFAVKSLTALTGGYGNFTFRLHLASPHNGQPTAVFKHGKGFLPGNEAFEFDLSRQRFEVEAMRWIHTWLPASSSVSIPKIHLFDEEAHCIVMEDCGEHSTTLKQFIKDGRCSSATAREVGKALGVFLARMHAHGSYPAESRLREMFHTNVQAKQVSASVTYGRLVSSLSGQDGLEALTDLDIGADDLKAVGRLADKIGDDIMTCENKFVMGDFWPGNILLDCEADASRGISLVDWELAKTGLPGHDLGQFLAEVHLLQAFHPGQAVAASALACSFTESYAEESGWLSLASEPTLLREVRTHKAAHLIAWTPRIPWGSKETTRSVVLEGYELLKEYI